jgi:hypothetical protein
MTTKNMYKKQNKDDAVNLYSEKDGEVSDINNLPLTEISEFEEWLDFIDKNNDIEINIMI